MSSTTPIADDFATIAANMQQATVQSSDTELLRLCADFAELERTRLRWDAGEIGLSEDQAPILVGKWHAAVDDILPIRPHTNAGLRAKAMALQSCIDGTMGSGGDKAQRFALALTADLLAEGSVAANSSAANPDAELIRRCHQFAEADLASWYRYVIAAENLADEQDTAADFDGYNWITATPATTQEGWRAKALALSAWDRTTYFNDEPQENDGASSLLASLLQDMVAPARNAILAKLATQYGPLPEQYTSEGRWLGWGKAKPADDPVDPAKAQGNVSAAAPRKESAPDSLERVEALWSLMRAAVEVAAAQCTRAGYRPRVNLSSDEGAP